MRVYLTGGTGLLGSHLASELRAQGHEVVALHRAGADVQEVTMADFTEALKDSRASVTAKMEDEYRKMRGELKKRAAEPMPIGFITEGMVESTRDSKHGN